MKDWQDRLAALEEKLETWNRSYDRELRRLLKERGLTGLFRRPSDSEVEVVSQDVRQMLGDDVLDEAFTFLDALGTHFLASGPQERGLVRARVGAAPALFGFLWSYVQQCIELVRSSEDAPRLRSGLAGLAIDDGRTEYHQVLETIARAWIAANRAGVDPAPIFAEVAKVANPGAAGGGTFLRRELADPLANALIRDKIQAATRTRSA